MRNGVLRLVALGIGLSSAMTRADDPAFRFRRDVLPPALNQDELLAIPFDSAIFAATQDGFVDMRLRDADGTPVPFLVRKRQTTRARPVRTTWPARQPSVRPLDDGGLEITIRRDDEDKHPPPNGLTLVTPLRNFRQRVRVFTSVDGAQWEPAGEDAVVFDYSRYMDVRNDSVPFPETDRRHIRIVINNVTSAQESELLAFTRRLQGNKEVERTEQATVERRPFRIDRIDFWREAREERVAGDETTEYPITDHRVSEDRDKQRTIVEFETQRQPLTSLEIETPDRNFSRHATVEAEATLGASKKWRAIGDGTLSRIDFKSLKREALSISFPESRHTRYRIVIENHDNAPLEISGVKAEGHVYELVYLASPERQDHLLYGAEGAERSSYDNAAISELLRNGFQTSPARLGPELPNIAAPAPIRWSKVFNQPFVVGGVVGLLVLILGCALYGAAKRIDKLPEN